jgi:hypothetical protein
MAITSIAEARELYKALLTNPESSFWSKEPKQQATVLRGFLATLIAKPGDEGYDIATDTVTTWTE